MKKTSIPKKRRRSLKEWGIRILTSPVTIALVIFSSLIWWQEGYFPLSWSEWQYRNLLRRQSAMSYEIRTILQQLESPSLSEIPTEKIHQQLDGYVLQIQKEYADFLKKYPLHDRAKASLGTFYNSIGRNETAMLWWAKACQITTGNPDVVALLAESYNSNGDPVQAIKLYESAINTNPRQAIYHFHLAQMYYLFRNETGQLHGWNLQTILDQSLKHFDLARQYDNTNFEYACSHAETYYGIHMLLNNRPWKEARQAWEECLKMDLPAENKDLVLLHLVRVNTYLNDPTAAITHLSEIRSPGKRKIAVRLMEKTFPNSFSGLLQI